MSVNKIPNYNFLAVTSVFFMIGMMGTRLLVPILSQELYASTFIVGIIVATFPLLPFLFSVQAGKIIGRVGIKKPLILSALFGSVSLMIPFLWPSLLGLTFSQIIAGICNTFYVIAAQSYVGQTKDTSQRDLNVMRFTLGVAIGTFIGPLLGGMIAEWFGSTQAFISLGLIGSVSAFLGIFIVENKEETNNRKEQSREKKAVFALLKVVNVRKAILLSTIILLGKDTFTSFFPLIAVEMGLRSSTIGMIVSLHALAGIIIRLFMPMILHNFTRNGVIVSSVVLSGLLIAIIPFFNQVIILSLVSFLLGMGLGLGNPLSISTTLYALPKNQISQGLGLRITANRFVQMTSPLLFGFVGQVLGLASIFWITGLIYIVGAIKLPIQEEKQNIHDISDL